MGKKIHDCTCGAFEDSCLNKVKIAEPIFVLRAQDETAPRILLEWINRFLYMHPPDKRTFAMQEKVNEAMALKRSMEDWPTRKVPD